MLFTWRRKFRQREAGGDVDRAAFIPAIIAMDEVGAGQPAPAPREQQTSTEDGSARRLSGLLEIVLASGSRVIVDREVSAAALARVIGVLGAPTDMRRGMNGLALQVQMKRDPHAGDLYVFRGRRGNLPKILWHDGLGMSLYAKRLEHGRFVWPSPAIGMIAISSAQLAYMLDGIDWRHPPLTWRPQEAG
jgi:transposase